MKTKETFYVTVKTLDGITIANRVAVIMQPQGGQETAKEVAMELAKDKNIPLKFISYTMEYSGYADEPTFSYDHKFTPSEILEIIIQEYLDDKSWKENINYENFMHWINVCKYSFKKIETGEKSHLQHIKNETGYDSVFDLTGHVAEFFRKYNLSKTPNKQFTEYNGELFLKYLSKFSNEDKAKMLFEVAKFIGEENLKELLVQCYNCIGGEYTITKPRLKRFIDLLPEQAN